MKFVFRRTRQFVEVLELGVCLTSIDFDSYVTVGLRIDLFKFGFIIGFEFGELTWQIINNRL